jgi:CheY-like chemotaxis protein
MNRTVLVVDDDDLARDITAQSLSMVAGWNVLEAYCGMQGIECARANHLDAILLDVRMPAMDGPAMLNRLKAVRSTAHIPVIFLTAGNRPSEQDAYASLPVEAILFKPFDPFRLAEQVAEVLGWPAKGPAA